MNFYLMADADESDDEVKISNFENLQDVYDKLLEEINCISDAFQALKKQTR